MENRFVELLVIANRTAISVQLIDFPIETQLIVEFGTRYNFRRHSIFFFLFIESVVRCRIEADNERWEHVVIQTEWSKMNEKSWPRTSRPTVTSYFMAVLFCFRLSANWKFVVSDPRLTIFGIDCSINLGALGSTVCFGQSRVDR